MSEPYERSPYKPKLTKRICLKCNKEFKSTGSSNRICKDCNTVNAKFRAAMVKDNCPKPKPTSE